MEWFFLKQMLDKINFKAHIKNCNSLPTQNSNRGYDVSVILESFITSNLWISVDDGIEICDKEYQANSWDKPFAVGAYFEKVGNTIKLKITLTKKQRKWFASTWDYPIE